MGLETRKNGEENCEFKKTKVMAIKKRVEGGKKYGYKK